MARKKRSSSKHPRSKVTGRFIKKSSAKGRRSKSGGSWL